MFDRIVSKLRTVADVGRMHGRRDYPGELNFVSLPVYAVSDLSSQAPLDVAAAHGLPEVVEPISTITPFRTLGDHHD